MSDAMPEIRVRRTWLTRSTVSVAVAGFAFGACWHERALLQRAFRSAVPRARAAAAVAAHGARGLAGEAGSRLSAPLPTRQSVETGLARSRSPGAFRDAGLRVLPAPGRGGKAAPGMAEDARQHMDAPVLLSDRGPDPTALDRMTAFAITGFLGISAFFGILAYVLLGMTGPGSRGT